MHERKEPEHADINTKVQHDLFSMKPPIRQFIIIGVSAAIMNILFQLLIGLLQPVQPVIKASIETLALSIFIIPFAYFFFLRLLSTAKMNKKQAEALLEGELRYKMISELTSDFVFKLGVAADGKIALDFASDSFYNISGFPKGTSLPFETLINVFHADDRSKVIEHIQRKIANAKAAVLECRADLGDGKLRWLSIIGKPEWSEEEHRVTSIIGAVIDMTERKGAEEKLLESQRQIEFILGATKTGLDIIDAQLNIRYVDPHRSEAFGEWVGKKCYEYFEDRSQFCSDCSLQKALQAKEISVTEQTLPKENNRPVQITAKPYQDKDGNWLVAEVIVDLTERRRSEDALRENEKKLEESEAKYRKLIETAPEAIYIIQNGKIAFFNNRAFEILGYSPKELMGMSMRMIISGEDWEKGKERYVELSKGKNMPISDIRLVTKEGKVLWVESVGEVIDWEQEPAVLYFVSDITDRKKTENDRLEYEQYLQQAQRLESLGILAGGIAHDFNNILTGIFGYADLARSEAKDEVVSEYLSQAMESMERAKSLTQQLLTFSKGGAPVKKIVPMPPLIQETCQFALHGSNARGKYDIPQNLWHCEIDKNQIGQVLQNLVLNAIQAMPMGGIIEITAKNVSAQLKERPTLKEGNYVAVAVKDQGIGISEEMLSRIFDPFFTTKIKGHGLGLAISHSIINRHGGAIDVQSDLGKGTTFTIYLPACNESFVVTSERKTIGHTGTGRILIMDDEKSIRELLLKMLHSFGYSVVDKENCKDTLEAFLEGKKSNSPFKAVILDLTIPGGMGGKEVAEEIRKIDKKVPLFVASGYAADPIIAQPEEYGFTASISKPFKMAELMEMFENHLQR
jgi:PAS domain S-box-containing protein